MVIPRWLNPSTWLKRENQEKIDVEKLLPKRTEPLMVVPGLFTTRRSKRVRVTGRVATANRRKQRARKQARKLHRGMAGPHGAQLSGKR